MNSDYNGQLNVDGAVVGGGGVSGMRKCFYSDATNGRFKLHMIEWREESGNRLLGTSVWSKRKLAA